MAEQEKIERPIQLLVEGNDQKNFCCVTNPEPPTTRGRSANQRIFAARPVGGSAGLRAAPFSGPPFGLLAKNGYVAA